ncbi:MAG: pilus assembly protein [Rhodomicrobium sp.]|nr:pilus assembly protein [Rhodomicrobium sp.]
MLRRGRRSERGATLIEFALVMVPFFLLLFGTLEVGFIFWGTHELENATEDAARQIRTGQVQAANMTPEAFKALVCSRVSLLAQCDSKLQLDVRSFANFNALQSDPPAPLNPDGTLKTSFNWSPGGPRSIVLVSTFYQWPLLNVISSASLSNMANGDRLLRASSAFQNENWPG